MIITPEITLILMVAAGGFAFVVGQIRVKMYFFSQHNVMKE